MAKERERQIQFTVTLDDKDVAEEIRWQATDSPLEGEQLCEAFLISLWDGDQKASLRIDLWTKKMQVDHMNAFFFQTFLTLADTFQAATSNEEVAEEIRQFARSLAGKLEMPPES